MFIWYWNYRVGLSGKHVYVYLVLELEGLVIFQENVYLVLELEGLVIFQEYVYLALELEGLVIF